MKKLTFIAVLAITALFFASCGKKDYEKFIGTWGVEKIEYYNIDYAGDLIPGSMTTYDYDPNSTDNGIQLVFRADKTGEMRDSAIDTMYLENEETGIYDIPIYCPDTVVVESFTYSYDKSEGILYLNMDYVFTYKLTIHDLGANEFVYENHYKQNFMERAYMKRIDKETTKSTGKSTPVRHPHNRPGSLFGRR